MHWQSALILLLVAALASVDLSALASMTSEPAADCVLALAASQTGLAALWCAAGGGSTLVRLAAAGLIVNVWSTALEPFSHDMAAVLLSELGVALGIGWCRRLLLAAGDDNSIAHAQAAAFKARVSLAEMLALATVFGLLLGPLPTLVTKTSGENLKLLGAALAGQVLAIGWAMLDTSAGARRWAWALAASMLPLYSAGQLLMSPVRGLRISLISAALLIGALAVVRVCGRLKAPVGAAA